MSAGQTDSRASHGYEDSPETCRSLPTPSTQALYAIASRYITVFDTTLSGVYIIKHAFDYIFDVRLPTSPETPTWIVTVLKGRRERQAVVATSQRLSSPERIQGLGLESSQVPAPAEQPIIAQPEDQVRPTYLFPALEECPQVGVLSIEALATSQAPSPAGTIPIPSPLEPNAPTPQSDTTFSTVFTPSGKTTSEVVFDATSDRVDEKPKDPAAASIPNGTRLSGVARAASVNRKFSQTNLPEKSRLPFTSLPGPREDDESRDTNSDSLAPKTGGMNGMGNVLSPLGKSRYAASPCTLPTIILTPSHQMTSKVIFDATSDYVSKSSCDSAPASNLNDTRCSGVSLATSSMSGRTAQNSRFGISTIPSPVLPDPPNEDGPPISNSDSLVTKPSGTNALGLCLSASSSKTVSNACSLGRPNCHVDDAAITIPQLVDSTVSTSSLSSHGGTPVSAITNSPAPTQSTAPTSIDLQNDHESETGTPTSIPCSTFQSPNDGQARDAEAFVREASDDGKVEEAGAWWRNDRQPKNVRNTRRDRYSPRKCGHSASEDTTDEEWRGEEPSGREDAVGGDKAVVTDHFCASDTVDAEQEEGSTDDKEDLDEEGLSKSQQQKVTEAPKKAMATPSYGASTSRAFQPLSEEEWASLEQFNATSSSLPDISPPPTPSSTGIETEVAQSWLPPPPPTLDTAPTKIKMSSRTKKVLKKIVKRVKATFRLKSRSHDAGAA
ncbi:hypothetical protein FS837_008820 [Tulasnella sp. UAMH 9824]|nr:hypothetical protein FS837_008820 [Tulasnella sp. UAMH 9824]